MRVLNPFLAGFLIAYCIDIPCKRLERQLAKSKKAWLGKIARPASIFIMLQASLLIVIFLLGLIIPALYENIEHLIRNLPTFPEKLIALLQSIPSFGALEFDMWRDSLAQYDWQSQIRSWAGNLDSSTLFSSFRYVTSFFYGLFNLILMVISSIYFLIESDKIKQFVRRLIGLIGSAKKRNFVIKYVKLADSSFRKYISCQLQDSLIVGVLVFIMFSALGSSYTILLSVMLAIVNVIPYFGSIIGSAAAVAAMAFDKGPEAALIAAIILLFLQQLDANLIRPKLMESAFSISPIIIILGISIGGAIGGIAGMIFAVPIVNVLKTLLEEYLQTKEQGDASRSKH
ncbi:MAG: AI-2E family transporter [Oscillospiraceae bacterium]|nr:AI-2E family transporter [Oscillospiraceae bacterium]